MSEQTRPSRGHLTRADRTNRNRITYICAIGFAVLGLFSLLLAAASIVLAVIAGMRGERRAWWIIPVALLLAMVHIAVRSTS